MKISWIEPERIAASGIPLDAKDINALHSQGIRALLSLTEQPLFEQREITPELLTNLDMSYAHIAVRDQYPPSMQRARLAVDYIDAMLAEKRPLLIHCHAGIGRTGTMLHLYYVMQGLTYEQAQQRIRATRVQCILLSDTQKQFINDVIRTGLPH